MATGPAWNVSNPDKPWLLWDSDANIIIPLWLDGWLGVLGTTYGDHQIITSTPLECVSKGSYSSGLVGVRMKLIDGAPFKFSAKYPFTVRLLGSDGQTRDDKTLWLKVKAR